MKHGVYTVHDQKAMAFLSPFVAKTDGEAIRNFMDVCSDVNHIFHRHAHDFHLYRIGSYEDLTAELKNVDPPEMLISAVNAIGPVGPLEAAVSAEGFARYGDSFKKPGWSKDEPVQSLEPQCSCLPLPEPVDDNCPVHGEDAAVLHARAGEGGL